MAVPASKGAQVSSRHGDARNVDLRAQPSSSPARRSRRRGPPPVYGALDLGTNNCRLLLARPNGPEFRVVDAFSRIIRLGEGITTTGSLSEPAMTRTIDALRVCTTKMARRSVKRARLIATEACRSAANGAEFVERVHDETGLRLEIVSRETEAQLAVAGCAALLDSSARHALVFDIGGGSSELMWVRLTAHGERNEDSPNGRYRRRTPPHEILGWTSLPMGVVSLSERFGGTEVTHQLFNDMVQAVRREVDVFHDRCARLTPDSDLNTTHLLGTSGTVTTLAGVHLNLPRYDRSRVDGCWLKRTDCDAVIERLLSMDYSERVASPCIGKDRADLVLAGCAILVAIQQAWPTERLRVADRGLREGILSELMEADGFLRPRRRRRFNGSGRSDVNGHHAGEAISG